MGAFGLPEAGAVSVESVPMFELPPPIEVVRPTDDVVVETTVQVRVRLSVNVTKLAQEYAEEYDAVSLAGGYREWERGAVFVSQRVAESFDVNVYNEPGLIDEVYTDIDEDDPRWTKELAARLDASLGRDTQTPMKSAVDEWAERLASARS